MAIFTSNALSQEKSQMMSQNPQPSVQTGSVFLNNTSYAGCDIKVLINLYDDGSSSSQDNSDIQTDLKIAEDQLEDFQNESLSIQLELSSTKPETQEYTRLVSRKSFLDRAIETQGNAIIAIKDKMANNIKQTSKAATKVLAECQTLSLSVFRDKRAVRACGTTYPKAFTRGPREIAGSLIFTVFDQHVVWDLLQAHPSDFDGNTATGAIIDQLPPVDIVVTFANEYGSMSRMTIYGAEFMQEGQTMSIEDLLTENAVSFVARDYDPMRKIGSRVKADGVSATLQKDFIGAQRASSLINEDDYQNFQKDSPYDRFLRRRNPFI